MERLRHNKLLNSTSTQAIISLQESELDFPMPTGIDQMSIQKFFMEQVQLGEEKLGMGK